MFSRSSNAYRVDSNSGGWFVTSTVTVTVADAEPPCPSETRTRNRTGPVASGAVQRAVAASVPPRKTPSAALHAYVRSSPSGSDAVAVSRTSPPGTTVHGSHDADTLGRWFDGLGVSGSGVSGSRGRGTSIVVKAPAPSALRARTRTL